MKDKVNKKLRLDQWLVENNFAISRSKAQAMILAGQILVNEQKIEKAGQYIFTDSKVRIKGEAPKYVGRGGIKLEGAIRELGLKLNGTICLDVGASTGGFTDCLLQHGATRVYTVDVGSNQLVWSLRNDERVVVRENINARYLLPSDFDQKFDIVTCDVSFISLEKIFSALIPLGKAGAFLIALVKPQFEVGKQDVGKGGIVRDVALHKSAVKHVIKAVEHVGFEPLRLVRSTIEGANGNVEFFLLAKYPGNMAIIRFSNYQEINKDLSDLFY